MEIEKGNIIYDFLKMLKANDFLAFAEISNLDINACYDGELIDYIKENDLIRSKGEGFKPDSYVYITENGKNVLNYNSWNEYIESKNKAIKYKSEKIEERQAKKDKIDKLTSNILEHQISEREKDEQIKTLTRDNLRLNNWDIRFRWLFYIASAIVGFLVKRFIDK